MNRSPRYSSWICCQLGAREHYAVPRVLNAASLLGALITDAWVNADSLFGTRSIAGCARLRGRYHSELCLAKVLHFTLSSLGFELRTRLLRSFTPEIWSQTLARNRWFQRRGVKLLKRLAPELEKSGRQLTLFAYSYAALEFFRFAKQRGWRTILGQIDGGRRDEEIVEAEHSRHSELNSTWQPAPAQYWRAWKDECALADGIVVNSEWSSRLLIEAGVEPKKLHVIPVAYDGGMEGRLVQREYPEQFTANRPLRILFLGAFALRKGAAIVLDAICLLQKEPVEFWIVGNTEVDVPAILRDSPNVKWIGPVSREATAKYYRKADLFLFPTISDGFGMTQVEARGWKLPVITTPYCAPIIKHNINGLVILKSDGSMLADSIQTLLRNPTELIRLSVGAAYEYEDYSLMRVRERYLALNL